MPVFDPVKPLESSYTVEEVARAWRKTLQFIRDEIHAGRLRAYRVGAELRLFQKDLRSYLEANLSRGPDPNRLPKNKREPVPAK